MNRAHGILVGLIFLASAVAVADIVHVPADQPTIQAGIDNASPGDTVLVAAGTWSGTGNTNLDFGGKAITVSSADGPLVCIVDGEGKAQGFLFHSGESPDSVLEGFTIRNGLAESGGGLAVEQDSSPTIRDCILLQNTGGNGGGMFIRQSTPRISNCIFLGNVARLPYSISPSGGGIDIDQCSPVISGCRFIGNEAQGNVEGGGAICCTDASLLITDCLFTGNTGFPLAGAICAEESSLEVIGCSFQDNSSSWGGAIFCQVGSELMVARSTFTGNTATNFGGAIGLTWYSRCTITNSVFVENGAQNGGGIYYARMDRNSEISGCTFRDNSSFTGLGGALLWNDPNGPRVLHVVNTIFWDNLPGHIAYIGEAPELNYCDVEGGYPGTGNIDADPLFAGGGDWHLTAGSPCIDSGNNGSAPVGDKDVDGRMRRWDGDQDLTYVVDMGASEYASPGVHPDIKANGSDEPLYVEYHAPLDVTVSLDIEDGEGLNADWWLLAGTPSGWWHYDCLSQLWHPGFNVMGQWPLYGIPQPLEVLDQSILPTGRYTFHFGLDLIQNGVLDAVACYDTITVQVGFSGSIVHVPGDASTVQAGIDLASDGETVLVADGIWTGPGNKNIDFNGKKITVRSANGPDNCVIDCEGEGRGFYFHNQEGPDSVLEGFTIRNGFAEGVYPNNSGGAVACYFGSPTISDCLFVDNLARQDGGGILVHSSSPTITNCTFLRNGAFGSQGSGGGLSGKYESPSVTGCTFVENFARVQGGGISCYADDFVVTGSSFTGNVSDGQGGGISAQGTTIIDDCQFTQNMAADEGGGLLCEAFSPIATRISNCTFQENTAPLGGGVLSRLTPAILTNCIITGNNAEYGAGAYYVRVPEIGSSLINCSFTENIASIQGGGVFNAHDETWDSTLIIVNNIFWNDGDNEIGYIWPESVQVTHSTVQGGFPGEGNLDSDPLFSGPDNLRLQEGSPCIDSGDNESPDLPPADLDGLMRIWDGDGDAIAVVDMGAYEYGSELPEGPRATQ